MTTLDQAAIDALLATVRREIRTVMGVEPTEAMLVRQLAAMFLMAQRGASKAYLRLPPDAPVPLRLDSGKPIQ